MKLRWTWFAMIASQNGTTAWSSHYLKKASNNQSETRNIFFNTQSFIFPYFFLFYLFFLNKIKKRKKNSRVLFGYKFWFCNCFTSLYSLLVPFCFNLKAHRDFPVIVICAKYKNGSIKVYHNSMLRAVCAVVELN